jgi:hypothetical protein
MTETQVMDLGSSTRRQMQLAVTYSDLLRSAGQTREAAAFAQFARRIETDVVTRTPQNLVTAYSSGSTFGYQIGPALEALENPANRRAKPGERLQRQSFPVLLIVAMDEPDITPKVYRYCPNGNPCGEGAEKYVLMRPVVVMTQRTRWVPTHWVWGWKRITEVERARWAASIAESRGSTAQSGTQSVDSEIADAAARGYLASRADLLAHFAQSAE